MTEAREITFQSGELTLEGCLQMAQSVPAPGIVVCHPHPLYGGDMRNNVVETLCQAAVGAGACALRFNFRGVGGSEGTHDHGRGEVDDARAALDYLRGLPEVDPHRLVLAGYSFGAAVALAAADDQLRGLIAVSCPTTDSSGSSARPSCPVLFVSGDRDEYSHPDQLQRLAREIGPQAEVVIHAGVDHFWWGSDDRLSQTVAGFLERVLGARVSRS